MFHKEITAIVSTAREEDLQVSASLHTIEDVQGELYLHPGLVIGSRQPGEAKHINIMVSNIHTFVQVQFMSANEEKTVSFQASPTWSPRVMREAIMEVIINPYKEWILNGRLIEN